jgi:hypothetical protein
MVRSETGTDGAVRADAAEDAVRVRTMERRMACGGERIIRFGSRAREEGDEGRDNDNAGMERADRPFSGGLRDATMYLLGIPGPMLVPVCTPAPKGSEATGEVGFGAERRREGIALWRREESDWAGPAGGRS